MGDNVLDYLDREDRKSPAHMKFSYLLKETESKEQ